MTIFQRQAHKLRTSRFVETKAIHALALAAFIILTFTTIVNWISETTAGERAQPSSTPLIYDLCLAYLAAYAFHFLVVVIPERKKVDSTFIVLEFYLVLIARNARLLITELEFITRSPHKGMSYNHISKVLMAANDNEAVRYHIGLTLNRSRLAFRHIEPFLPNLPLSLQIALQNEQNRPIYHQFPHSEDRDMRNAATLNEEVYADPAVAMNKSGKTYKLDEEGNVTWEKFGRRRHLARYATYFEDYANATISLVDEIEMLKRRTSNYSREHLRQVEPVEPFRFPGIHAPDKIRYPATAESDLPGHNFKGEDMWIG